MSSLSSATPLNDDNSTTMLTEDSPSLVSMGFEQMSPSAVNQSATKGDTEARSTMQKYSQEHSAGAITKEIVLAAPPSPDGCAVPWGHPVGGRSFTEKYKTEFRTSGIPDSGLGWWANQDIPCGTRLRRVTVADGSLLRFADEAALRATGWSLHDAFNYGIAHKSDRGSTFFLHPGTAMNHADPTRQASVQYKMDVGGEMELWTIRDVRAGEEIFNQYERDFVACGWYDELCTALGAVPLGLLGLVINSAAHGRRTPPHRPVTLSV